MTDISHILDGKSEAVKKEYASIAYVAHLYYDKGLLQPEIAEQLFYSRAKVSRILKQARKLGIVEITVHPLLERISPLETRLKDTFGLKDAVVVSNLTDTPDVEYDQDFLLNFAASYISDLISGDQILGITDGTTLEQLVKRMKPRHSCYLQALQLMGSSSTTFTETESRQLVNDLLENFPGTGHYVNAPLFIEDERTFHVMLHDKTMQDILMLMQHSDIAIAGIRSIDSCETECAKWGNYMTPAYYKELTDHKAAGCICAQYYDIEGNVFDCTWNTHCVRMPLENFRKLGTSIGIASGERKVEPILGALRGHFFDTLITDSETAASVLELVNA